MLDRLWLWRITIKVCAIHAEVDEPESQDQDKENRKAEGIYMIPESATKAKRGQT
jgi:hypothetical protein